MGPHLALPNLSGVRNKIPSETWFGKAIPLFYLSAAVMAASLILGGGTRGGFLSDAVLQLLAIPLLLVSLFKLFEVPLTKQARLALWFCLAIVALPLAQLVPLPPWLWTVLPNRQPSVEAFDILGQSIPWMPISVSPHATWLSLLALLPPLAIFLGTVLLGYRDRCLLSLVVLAIGVLGLFVGLLQVAQGSESSLRFFEFTNLTEAVGFFANRNHFAALLYCLMLFVAAWTIYAAAAIRTERNPVDRIYEYNVAAILMSIGGFTVLVAILAGEAMARSRAGLILTIFALFGVFALAIFDWRGAHRSNQRTGFTTFKLLLGAISLAALFVLQFAVYRIQERFAYDPMQDARYVFIRNTAEAAMAYMPLGSGLGTFVPVYAMFEKPEDISNAYVNHAHSDILEVWLETGIAGVFLIGLFVIWLIRRSLAVWRNAHPQGVTTLDRTLSLAATMVIALVLVHSLVDYPLRTGAIMAITAFACALLIEPPAGSESGGALIQALLKGSRRLERVEPKAAPSLKQSRQLAEKADAPSRSSSQRWGADMAWPKEWTKP